MQDSLRMILMGMLIACFVGIVLLAVYLVTGLLKQHSLRQLYEGGARDFRFVCELLRLYTNKNGIIKNPCLLRSYEGVPPRADAIVVGGGGVLILTVVDRPGQYKTPVNGNWSVWQDGEAKQIPNALLPGKQYTSVLSGILVKNGLSCPIVNVAVLTDDYAQVDSLYDEYALTGDRLVPYVQEFAHRRSLSKSGQAKLIAAIKEHHERCQRQLSSTMVGDVTSIFDSASVAIEDEPKMADATAAPEMFEQTIEPEMFEQTIVPETSEQTIAPEMFEQTIEPETFEQTIAPETSEQTISLDELFTDVASDDRSDRDRMEEMIEMADFGEAENPHAADADKGDNSPEDILAALLDAIE